MNIFVIDKESNVDLGTLDFIPRGEEQIILNNNIYNVKYIFFEPKECAVFVFVSIAENL